MMDYDMSAMDHDLSMFFDCYDRFGIDELGEMCCWQSQYFNQLIMPVLCVYLIHKNHGPTQALKFTHTIQSDDWRIACEDWLTNREINLSDTTLIENTENSPMNKRGKIDAIQIGGNHYKSVDYQHWNMVRDTSLPYVLGCAIKYITRWKNKNGVEDLKKSIHYVEKANVDLISADDNPQYYKCYKVFLIQFDKPEQEILELIWICEYEQAIKLINELIEEVENGSTSNYVGSDNNYIRG
jgi:hypothetical protein